MAQTKKQSLIEAATNGVIGVTIGTTAWLCIVEPIAHSLGWPMSRLELHQALIINIFFLCLHITKAYLIRRFFDKKER